MTSHHDPLPFFHFHSIDLHRDEPTHHEELFQRTVMTETNRSSMGTQIWWATRHSGAERCLKEFYLADTTIFGRQLPDPIWKRPSISNIPTGRERGLAPRRADLFDRMQSGALKKEIVQSAGQHNDFLSQFNAYSFEVEALITQFARHYQCDQLVRAHFWGPLQLSSRETPRHVIEMEKLQPLPTPPIGESLAIANRLLQMMTSVMQLHSMLIPIRCYPPELTSDLTIARKRPITRPFHYDLSIDQFMQRTSDQGDPPQVVLIDFNASRTAQTEYSNFSWQTIPGKDYYQAPERREKRILETGSFMFQSNPIYDLYSLLVLGLFMFMRKDDGQQKIQQIEEWQSLTAFYNYLFQPDFRKRLRQAIPNNKGIQVEPLFDLLEATLQNDPSDRHIQLQQLPALGWGGISDWMLLPKATNMIARKVIGRDLRIAWKDNYIRLEEGSPTLSFLDLVSPESSQFTPGKMEQGRINLPLFSTNHLFFLQEEDTYPIVRGKLLEPRQAGSYTVYASWNGCIDFANPLHVEVEPSTPTQDDLSASLSHSANYPLNAPTQLSLDPTPHPFKPDPTPHAFEPAPTPQEFHLRDNAFETVHQPKKRPSEEFIRRATPSPAAHQQAIHHTPPKTSSGPHETVDFNRDDHSTPFEMLVSSQPPSVEMLGVSLDDIPHQKLNPSPRAELEHGPDLQQWMSTVHTCDDVQRLNFMDTFIKSMPKEGLALYLQINIRTRLCQLALKCRELRPTSPILQHLASLYYSLEATDPSVGLLLNNLAVCSYESAYQNQQTPQWEETLGFDPAARLRSWLNRTDPSPAHHTPAKLWELRERSRETLDYCNKIRWSLPS